MKKYSAVRLRYERKKAMHFYVFSMNAFPGDNHRLDWLLDEALRCPLLTSDQKNELSRLAYDLRC